MPVTTHSRPELRPRVKKLLKKLVPAVKRGGEVSLSTLITAVADRKLDAAMKKRIAARGSIVFVQARDRPTTFSNEGAELDLAFASFDLQVPKRIAGAARLVEDGVYLRFEVAHSLHAKKFFFQLRIEGAEVTSKRVFVDVEGSSFDQQYDLI